MSIIMRYILRYWQTIVISTAFWCVLNESFAIKQLLEGIAVASITSLCIHFLFRDQRSSSISYRLSIYVLIKFLIILCWNIYISAIITIKVILFGKPSPAIVRIHTNTVNIWHKCLIANAITLTPGTVTLNLKDNELIVLWLTPTINEPQKIAKLILGPYEKALAGRSI